MGRFVLVLVALVFASSTAPAEAVTVTYSDGATPIPRLQAWVDAARVPTAAGVVRVVYETGPTRYTHADRTIHVSTDSGERLWRLDFLHEIGHDFEATVTDEGWRQWARWTGMNLPRGVALTLHTFDGDQVRLLANEHFADWYAACATKGRYLLSGPNSRTAMTDYGRIWNRKRLRQSCARIWDLV